MVRIFQFYISGNPIARLRLDGRFSQAQSHDKYVLLLLHRQVF